MENDKDGQKPAEGDRMCDEKDDKGDDQDGENETCHPDGIDHL